MKKLFIKIRDFDILDGIPLFLVPIVIIALFAYVGLVTYVNSVALGWLIGIPAFFAGLLYYVVISRVTVQEGNKSYGLLNPKWQAALVWLNQIVICYWLVTASGFGAIGYIFVMLVVIPTLYISMGILLSREVTNVEKN